ncbi:unnamed protein product [Kluyveromyces dobzhanskii CBS 2104]|uniref:WGS project CCBQ000000000 data, contig MAT n=1 Tax=Kluyveromyces dobzhanskii CBS 2104 TaxID=1427455 RepID=A0A0A8L1A3_9SACH|nr:unnamed protein product [Kluyveromyces dobzhanskii CBS 2104]
MDPVFKKRDELLKKIPFFWNIVLTQHSDFANYVRASDFKYFEAVKSIVVEPLALKDDTASPRDFQVTIEFDDIEGDLSAQTITKVFKIENDVSKISVKNNRTLEDDELDSELGFLTSEPVSLEWPNCYEKINPDLISDKSTLEGKKNYRTGMKTFFAWFRWTGLRPGKEFPNGDSLANLFNEELYPYCVKYYTEAQRDVMDESDTDSEDDSDAALDVDVEEREDDSDSKPLSKKTKLQ